MIVERLDPYRTEDRLNRELHLERYRWAGQWIQGGDVLDIACGVGYGSAILAEAETAPRVLGVDRSAEAVALAKERHEAEKVSFEVIKDAETFTSERRFETIVCLETLEHLPRPVAFLRRLHALLVPGGTLVVSAPVGESPGDNPYHLHCFTSETFRAVVAEGFEIKDELDQLGAYSTLVARRREPPCLAWSTSEGPARVTIALVTWNSLSSVVDLVSALRAFTRPPYELLVTDNASSDGTRSFLRLFRDEPWFRLVENEENLRCARATNEAIASCRTELLVYLCASHALVTEVGWDEGLVEFLGAQPELGIAGDVWNPGFPLASTRYANGWTPEAHGLSRLLHVQGGAWVARRSLFDEVGSFAEQDHPHAGMDVEFSYRLLSLGRELGRHPAICCPPSPRVPERQPGVSVYHPASSVLRAELRRELGHLAGRRLLAQRLSRAEPGRGEQPAAIVFCERLDNESFCESVVRELGAYYEVRPCGPGWPVSRLSEVDTGGARFFLELDSASGNFVHADGLEDLALPKFAWLIDTHKKPGFHQAIAQDMDLTFFAAQTWGHVLPGQKAWLPAHADQEVFFPREHPRDLDVVFVGSQAWRAEPLVRISERHRLKVHVASTTGPREKSQTAELYARARLVFNRHVTNDLNFRVFEAISCGRVLLTDAQWNGQYELFEDGRHFVLYKDEPDLERQILRYLADEGARVRIEREAARHAREHHTTRARVAELHQAIERFLAARAQPESAPLAVQVPSPAPPPPPAPTTQRWLFFAGAEPDTVLQQSYAERLAWELAGRGHEVVVARARRTQLPSREPGPGEPRILELDWGPLPLAPSQVNQELTRAGPLLARLDRAAQDHGPFEGVVGEGALGALVAAPLAERTGAPFFLALERCEVARRKDQLTEEHLYLAKLEHWGSDRAAGVLLAFEESVSAVKQHYKAEHVHHVVPSFLHLRRPESPGRLLRALGLAGVPFLLVLAPPLPEAEMRRLLSGPPAQPSLAVLLASDDVWLRGPAAEAQLLSRQPAAGPALAALMLTAQAVAAFQAHDLRVLEATALGARLALWSGDRPPAGLGELQSTARTASATPAEHSQVRVPHLEGLLALRRPVRAIL